MYFLAIDEGSSSTRAILYNEEGRVCYKSQQSLNTMYPASGWVEQDPDEIWEKTCLAMREVVAAVNVADIRACGITNQRETTVIWHKQTGQCLGPAISWQDRRTEALFAPYTDAQLSVMQAKTGLIPNAYFSASKLQWLLENVPKARALADEGLLAFGTIDTYLLWRLTKGGQHATDVTNASRTLLFDIERRAFDDELLDWFSIPPSVLPRVLPNACHFGDTHPDVLGAAIPVTAMAGDQQSSLVGQACIEKGMMKATYGSGAFLLLNTGDTPARSSHLLTTIAYEVNNEVAYGLEGSIYHAGTTLKWLRNTLKILPEYADSEQFAKRVAGNDGVYFLPSFTSLGAPHWITPKGASITGLTQGTKPEHIVRAALEAVAFQTKDVIRCIQTDAKVPLRGLHADGGMAQNAWFLQYLSSMCEVVVKRPVEVETTALGVAMLAAVGCGYLDTLSDTTAYWSCGEMYCPDEQSNVYAEAYQGWVDMVASVKQRMRGVRENVL
ncbi:MAG: glycerol kinase GlpK [Legionellaceae bacterium]|nr:glycerol kinase GlpK [Legionellaceae bacterium]